MTDNVTDACGIIFLDKPLGWSSRQAVNEVSRLFSVSGKKRIKAGHGGTLDPLATGMLPILLGEATRFAELGLQAEKSYRVSFDLSYQTDTLDREGKVISHFDGELSREQLEQVLPKFRGKIEQVPPIYSAIRIDGKRAHDMARKGQDVEMKPRPVTVHKLALVAFEFPIVTLEISCSKGTYIRSLARDIGAKLDFGGCVTMLRRLTTGGWPEVMMVTMPMLEEQKHGCLITLGQWLRDFQRIDLRQDEAKRFLQGQRIQLRDTKINSDEDNQTVAVFADDEVIATATIKAGLRHMVLHPLRILPSAQRKYV